MKAYWGVERYSSTLTLTLERCEWSASQPGRFTPTERAPGTNWIGGWMGHRAGLDTVLKRNTPSPSRDSNPRSSSPQRCAIPLSYHGSLSIIRLYFKFNIIFVQLEPGWEAGFQIPAGAWDFSSHRVQIGSGAHPASYRTRTTGSFPGGKAAGTWSWAFNSIHD
jgi:hypothetical protein